MAFDLSAIRRQFPILARKIGEHPLVYLDNAATAQKPAAVLDAMRMFYETHNANPHRGMHPLAEEATVAYENARKAVQRFIHAASPAEIVFTKNATEGMNMVAKSLGSTFHEGDVVVLSLLEHHANIVPWLQLKEEKDTEIKWIECENDGRVSLASLEKILKEGNVKLVSITAQSNVLGVCPDIAGIVKRAHAANALVLVDAAQWVAHHPTDVAQWDADFLVFSGHKLYGPMGIGVLYGKKELLERMPPFLGGGMMIQEVHQDRFSPADLPQKFEAGTQPVAESVGLAAAIDWMSQYAWKDIAAHETSLLTLARKELSGIDDITILSPEDVSGCISFVMDGIHPHDLTEIVGREGVCLRAGHHCTQPLHKHLKQAATSRLSVGIYNTEEEILLAANAIKRAAARLRGA